MIRAKVVLLGDQQVGKTVMANFLADTMLEPPTTGYRPTQGVRVLEFECHHKKSGGKRTDATLVELWDVSGDPAHEDCWPALAQGADGAILVCDADGQDAGDGLLRWFNYFVKQHKLKKEQVAVFCNKTRYLTSPIPTVSLAPAMQKAAVFKTNISANPEHVRDSFTRALQGMRAAAITRRDREEKALLN